MFTTVSSVFEVEIIIDLDQIKEFETQNRNWWTMIDLITTNNSLSHFAHHFESALGCFGGRIGVVPSCFRRREKKLPQLILRRFFDRQLGVVVLNIPPTESAFTSR
jgi:hypothetical protein